MEESQFRYQSLNHRQIRILHLAPGETGDQLVGDLRIENLDDEDLDYDALSYMWGNPAPTGAIRIGDQMLPIALNLNAALQSLRYPDKTLVIWVDAICINQTDLNERAQQVPLMRQLYSRTRIVRSWINASVDTTCEAFKALQSFEMGDDIGQCYGLGPDPTFYNPVAPIFANPYWERVWVQQEVLSAKDWAIHCAETTLNQANITAFHVATKTSFVQLKTCDPTKYATWRDHFEKNHTRAQHLFLEKKRSNWSKPLYRLLHTSANLQSTDSRDTPYACMHLASDYVDGSIQVDYTKTRWEVLLDAAEYHVKHNKNVQFLSMAYAKDLLKPDGAFTRISPTWFPLCWVWPEERSRIGYRRPSESLWGDCQSDIRIDMSSYRLGVRGLQIDCVSRSLTSELDTENFTATEFWSSDLGEFIDSTYSIELMMELYYLFSGHEVALMDPLAVATVFLCLRRMARDAPDMPIRADGEFNPMVINELAKITPRLMETLTEILYTLEEGDIIVLDSGNLGLVKKEVYEIGDEIWIVLGCHLCITLRPQPDDVYWFSCPAVIPAWEKAKGFTKFTEHSQVGDRIEDWVVEEIEIG